MDAFDAAVDAVALDAAMDVTTFDMMMDAVALDMTMGEDAFEWPLTTVFVNDEFDSLRAGIWNSGECPESYSCTTPPEEVGSSNHVMRIEWHPWDKRSFHDDGHNKGGAEVREELAPGVRTIFDPVTGAEGWDVRTPGGTPAEGSVWPTYGQDIWYRWRFRVVDATGIDVGNATSVIMGQWHHQDSLGESFSPPLALTFIAADASTDRVAVVIMLPELPHYFPEGRDGCTYSWSGGTHCQFTPFKVALPKSDRGNWHEVMFHLRSAGHDVEVGTAGAPSTGFLEFYFDGVAQSVTTDIAGTNVPPAYAGATRLEGLLLLNNGHINYLQIGLYVLGWPEPQPSPPTPGNIVVDYDDFRAWRTTLHPVGP